MEAPVIVPALDLWDDPNWYPAHEEDNVPETIPHYDASHYLCGVLGVHVKDGWTAGDTCCYWVRGDTSTYLGPDVVVVNGTRPEPPPNTYLSWIHERLRLVIEIGSPRTYRRDQRRKLDRYAEGLLPEEYLYYYPRNDDLRLYRRSGDGYVAVLSDDRGWVWSQSVGFYFGVERPSILRAYTRDGLKLLTHEEESARADAAERRLAAIEEELARVRRARDPNE